MNAPVPRSAPTQQGPPASLAGIPTGRPTGTHWFREHARRPSSSDGGCWWYAALPEDSKEGGRFDLPAPEGTCYFANSERAAAMERVGRFTARRKPVPAGFVEGRVVTTVETSALPPKAVNLLAVRAHTHFGVNGELFTMSDYSMTQAWAAAIRTAGHVGLTYTPRFTPDGRAIAVFGPQGARPQTVGSSRALRDVLDTAHIAIVDVPPIAALTVVDPPAWPGS